MSDVFVTYENWDRENLILEIKRLVVEVGYLKAENDKLRQAMEWISVEDRLPERSSEDVITCIHYGNRHFAYEYENYYLPDTNEWANPLHKWTHWTKAILPPEVD